ncbi:ABC transporter [Streptomyces sp. NPDC050617]|uniref:ABC transporter n=1 Tax=Streptomyces sp. NPDC050617 TaxID=3154628 RepID=UPI003412F8DB
MTSLYRYQAALLIRSHRLLPPLTLYVLIMGIGVQAGQPILDSFGWAGVALLLVAAWFVRICVTNEPPAARHVAAAATSPARVHLASVLTALTCSVALGTIGTAFVAIVSDPRSSDRQIDVPVGPAILAGLLTALACALLGTAVGALCNRPLLRGTGWTMLTTMVAAMLVLVVDGSPAHAAVTGLVTGSASGRVTIPLLPLAATAVLAAGATALACALSARRP